MQGAKSSDIIKDLQDSKTVIIDTSEFAGSVELLIGSMIATELLSSFILLWINRANSKDNFSEYRANAKSDGLCF